MNVEQEIKNLKRRVAELEGSFTYIVGQRANVEQCLLATRGSPPRMAKDVRRLVISPRREHSRKPDEIYGRIERLARGPYLELFSRQSREGWDAWGYQPVLFDEGTVPTRNRPSHMGHGARQYALGIE
jgi:N6-adenosine-specific RNA methylase IME4